jgi:hypothetical protein
MSDENPATPEPIAVLFAGLLVPGAGAWLLGRTGRGAAYFAALAGTFLVGLAVTKGHAVSWQDHPIILAVEAPAGLVALIPAIVDAVRGVPGAKLPPEVVAMLDMGYLFCMVAGLLNLLLAVDCYERAGKRRARA